MADAMGTVREICVYNRQRGVRFDLGWLRRFAALALAECEGEGIAAGVALEGLGEIEVSVVSDRVIAGVHKEFMGIEGATDVITFEHGEIVMSADTALRQGREFGQGVEEELGLYVVHGILHLNGYDDVEAGAAGRMREAQEGIWRRVVGACDGGR
jgi:probable rRNA maturation factor